MTGISAATIPPPFQPLFRDHHDDDAFDDDDDDDGSDILKDS